MKMSNETSELFKALAQLRTKIKQPKKDAKNPFFKSDYVTLEGVENAIDEALKTTQLGLWWGQFVENTEAGIGVSTMITHESGQWLQANTLILNPVKNDPQGLGSAITYEKRYQLSSLFGISSDIDDDGNASSFINTQNTQSKKHYTPDRVKKTANQNQPANQDQVVNLKKDYLKLAKELAKLSGMDLKDVNETIGNEFKNVQNPIIKYQKSILYLKNNIEQTKRMKTTKTSN